MIRYFFYSGMAWGIPIAIIAAYALVHLSVPGVVQ